MNEHTALGGAVIAVAGGAGPAGQAVLARLAAAGAVVPTADRDADRLAEAVEAAQAGAPGTVHGETVDLLDPRATEEWAERIERKHGRIDGLVHLVGGWRGGKEFTPHALDDWEFLYPLLVRTVQHTSLAFREALLRSERGRYVLVSAAGAAAPTAGNAAYAAAKAAAEAWTLALADSIAKAPGGSDAAAVILVVKALVHRAMREQRPNAKFAGFTDVADLAGSVAELWTQPANDLNGHRIWLSEK